jgi:hypothetical protein
VYEEENEGLQSPAPSPLGKETLVVNKKEAEWAQELVWRFLEQEKIYLCWEADRSPAHSLFTVGMSCPDSRTILTFNNLRLNVWTNKKTPLEICFICLGKKEFTALFKTCCMALALFSYKIPFLS